MDSWTLTWSKLIDLNLLTSLSIPNFSGVYRLSYLSSDGRIYVFYVGQAEDLKGRILQHIGTNETNMCIKRMLSNYRCYIRYARVNDSRVRDGAELYLYRHYSPSCNLVEPSGPQISINLE